MRLVGLFLMSLIAVTLSSSQVEAANLLESKSKWVDSEGTKKKLADFKGRPTLVAMVYTSCPHACPMTVNKIKKILADFEKEKILDAQVILASFDSEKDTPEQLSKFSVKQGLDRKIWHLLSPIDDKQARELSVLLGVNYKSLGDGDFSHSNIITLLSPTGEILSSIQNLNADHTVLIEALKKK